MTARRKIAGGLLMAAQDLIPVAEAGLTARGLISVEEALHRLAVHNLISVEVAWAVRNLISVVAPRRRVVPGRMPAPALPAEDPDPITAEGISN
jgi:hypothetical protein